jgi:hypothetical protein
MFLRIDEVTNLVFESIEMIPGESAHLCIMCVTSCSTLTWSGLSGTYFSVALKTRKTAQTGVLHTWKLHANDWDEKICPVRALIRLAMLYGEDVALSGPLFLRVNSTGAIMQPQPAVSLNLPPLSFATMSSLHLFFQTSGILSRALSKDLQNIGYLSWALYGTHSFRRGGCQHRIKNKGWSVDMVAAWGGWTQVEAVTMFRYFYSPNDNHEFMDDYDRNDGKRPRYF